MLQHTHIGLLSAALISILFFFFAMRVRFSKHPSLKGYAVFFYAFIFYTIGAIAYIVLNAMSNFFRLSQDFYHSIWWFFPVSFLCAAVGALCGWLIYFAAKKVAEPYTYKLLNASLIIIIPSLTYTLLVQPLHQTFEVLLYTPVVKSPPKEVNAINLQEITADTSLTYLPAMPREYFDSLQIEFVNQKLRFVNPANGFSFYVANQLKQVAQIYVSQPYAMPYTAILLLSPVLQNQSELLLIDGQSNCVFKKKYNAYYNVMSTSANGHYLRLQSRTLDDSLSVGIAYNLSGN
jgi:hypothetical protein